MLQGEFISTIAERPDRFAWFLGAGTSRTAGLPTASDIIWDLKRRFYRQEENRDVSPQDIQNDAVRARIQAFMDSRGFPELWAEEEYSTYFEKIFGDDRERQRRYLKGILSEDKVTLSVGNRVLSALMVAGLTRAVFTTNFDSVVESAVAEVGGMSLQAYSLEGTKSARNAILNEEFPFYCKLHGDFRFESLKNLSADLASQNDDLAAALLASGSRFGLVVAGYSGRDASVMSLLSKVLDTPNPFPHGLYWTGLKGFPTNPSVETLLGKVRAAGATAEYVEIETFDALMSRLWRSIDNRPANLDERVRKAKLTSVNIPLPTTGSVKPLVRLNALPVQLPERCFELQFKEPMDWKTLREISTDYRQELVVTKGESVLCWGLQSDIHKCFGNNLQKINEVDLPTDFQGGENLHAKAFIEEAVILALSAGKPLLPRMKPSTGYLIVDAHAEDVGTLDPLQKLVGKTTGKIQGLLSPVSEKHPESVQVYWAESLGVSLDKREGRTWLLLRPDLWIWPAHARSAATDFLSQRKRNRLNQVHNKLLSAWVEIVLGTSEHKVEIDLRPFSSGNAMENPTFRIGSRTAFSRRVAK